MARVTLHPIDMPYDDLGSFQGYNEQIRSEIRELITKAHAQGRWRASEDILWNPHDLEFVAYWAQKCIDPITSPKKGSRLEEYFRPFKKTQFDLTPPGCSLGECIRLSATGDLMPAIHIDKSTDRLFERVADLIFGADCAFANLECSLAPGRPRRMGDFEMGETPILSVTHEQYHALTHHRSRSFDVLQLANNHILDGGEAGLAKTVDALKGDGIDFVGVYESEEAAALPTTTKIDDIKIGWVAHTFSVNQKPLPDGKPWMIDVTPFHVERTPDTSRIARQIDAARSAGCDVVVACLHWGAEWEFFPLPAQLDWAHAFAEQGADAIIGTHPHVIQPIEIYRPASQTNKAVPIIYSLGNLTPTMGAAYTTLSLVANLTISRGRVSGSDQTTLTTLEVTPVAFMGEEEDGRQYATCISLQDLNKIYFEGDTRVYVERMNGYADLVLGKEWRTDHRGSIAHY